MSSNQETGAEQIRWDLTLFYKDLDDPQHDADLKEYERRAAEFNKNYKGKLTEKLGAAISDCAELDMLANKAGVFLFLLQSLDVTDAKVKAKSAEADRIFSAASGEYLTFFEIELVALSDEVLEKLYREDEVVRKHRPWIEHIRVFKPHLLSEPVESALTKRSPFGVGAWSEFFDEYEADLRFEYKGEKNLTEMLDVLSNSQNAEDRAEVLKVINEGLGGMFAKYSAQTLYMVAGKSSVERKERGYKHPMDGINKSNRIPDAVVDALHDAVLESAAPLCKRYYQLKAKLLGQKNLKWSDRNAPLPFADVSIMSFDAAMKTVLAAYESFSPTLAELIKTMESERRIDAPATKGKRGGAFNYSMILPGNRPASFTFLNYLGSNRDVMTIAHELGHGVHGILAAEAQGPLMFHAPIAYCETASVFGEMTAFNFLKKQMLTEGKTEALLALITARIDDVLNTVVRQIGFSNFERRLHGMDAQYKDWGEPKKMSAEELDVLWLQTLKEFYGDENEIFTYENTEHLWAYVSHFQRPFYVYGYAFGELLTESLYAQREKFGEKFEPLYLDLLRSGSTKDVVELLKPFELDPTNRAFWEEGIRLSLGVLIEEAEQLAAALV